MRAVVQRVASSRVTVDERVTGEVKKGLLVLLGVTHDDTSKDVDYMVDKVTNLRIFEDENDKMNLSLLDVKKEALVVSNFTICADTTHGNRPSFMRAAEPDLALALYNSYCEYLKKEGVQKIERGIFGADMQVQLLNDGPVTIILDTNDWRKKHDN